MLEFELGSIYHFGFGFSSGFLYVFIVAQVIVHIIKIRFVYIIGVNNRCCFKQILENTFCAVNPFSAGLDR
jgi:hypothetical protein